MKVGIVCDNYKVENFKSKLDDKKLIYTTMVYSVPLKLTLIQLICEKHQVDIIADICTQLEISFQHLNSKN